MAAVKRGLDGGTARLGPGRADVRLCGRCQDPRVIEFAGQVPPATKLPPDQRLAEWRSSWNRSSPYLWITIHVPCRVCTTCLRGRARLWRQRATNETVAAPRSWFGTITLHPEAHSLMKARACQALSLRGETFEALPAERQLEARHSQCGQELTRYLKRVRKECGAFRYLLVLEAHRTGLPHYHVLLHEREEGQVKHAVIKSQWRLGFTRWKLAEASSSAYVCKYLTKSSEARVRASTLYGELSYLTDYYALKHSVESDLNAE